VNEANQTLRQRAVHEMREYLLISFYLFVVFSLFVVYKSVILAEHHISFALHGIALFNALALAKVTRTQEVGFGRRRSCLPARKRYAAAFLACLADSQARQSRPCRSEDDDALHPRRFRGRQKHC
jgi:hypothetical protein